ncbi:hypothetical protein [Arthrobacter sp. ES1]|uniref:hypothetical protein n=1 Tax=Arthrobacter sp. ES1 TaxID=1897056 RepID=UPI001CFFB5F2|nr:hypothetical protein [Arthrobacter sp. ES1]MCB5280565.1 hypothetical protein [Arthrobacter sp. ES1]
MARTPEGIIEDHLLKQCKKLKFMCLKFTSPGNTGVPDRVIIGNGQTVFLELKRPGEGPRRLQEEVIAEMISHGAAVRVADTKDLVDELLAEIIAGSVRVPAPKPLRKARLFTPRPPDITGRLRDQLAQSLPTATPAQVDELMTAAGNTGRALTSAGPRPLTTSATP